MKGTVQIYKNFNSPNQELVLEKENLIVDSGVELLVDMLVQPSAINIIQPGILDTSNWVPQTMSFGKAPRNYQANAHSFESKNLLHNSSNPTASGWDLFQGAAFETNTTIDLNDIGAVSANIIQGPTKDTSGSLIYDNSDTSWGALGSVIVFAAGDGEYSRPPQVGSEFVFSVDLKYNFEIPPAEASSTGERYSEIWFRDGNSGADSRCVISWTTSGEASIQTSSTEYATGEIQNVGGGYYRVSIPLTYENNGSLRVAIYPNVREAGFVESGDSSALTGSVYIARPQVEIGKHFTTYRETTEFFSTRNDFDLSSQAGLSAVYGVTGTGTVRNDASAFHPSAFLPEFSQPLQTSLQSSSLMPIESEFGFTLLPGQNLNLLPYLHNSRLRFHNYQTQITRGTGIETSAGNFGTHAFYWGCYPQTGGTTYHIVSALDTNAVMTQHPTGSYQGYFNEVSSMDMFGFVRGYFPYLSATAPSNPVSGVIVSADTDFSSTGKVKYVLTIGAGDLGLANLYGGIYTLGLWAIDVAKSLQIPSTVPFSFHATNIRRKYKLFSTRVFNDNLARSDDNGTTPGAENYSDLAIVWTLDLL